MEIAVLVISALVKYGPDVAQAIHRMLSSRTPPTQAEWDALFAKADKSYDTYIAEAEKRAGG